MEAKYKRKIFYWLAVFAYFAIALGWAVIAIKYDRIHFSLLSWFFVAAYIALAVREIRFYKKDKDKLEK